MTYLGLEVAIEAKGRQLLSCKPLQNIYEKMCNELVAKLERSAKSKADTPSIYSLTDLVFAVESYLRAIDGDTKRSGRI
jgi:hypothetical protein